MLSLLEHCATLLLRYLSIFTDLAAEKIQLWRKRNRDFRKSTSVSKRDEKWIWEVRLNKEKAKQYTNWNYWMQQVVHSTQNVSQLIKLDCKRVEPDAYMLKLTHFTVSKNWHKIPVDNFWPWGRSPPSPLGVGAYGKPLSLNTLQRTKVFCSWTSSSWCLCVYRRSSCATPVTVTSFDANTLAIVTWQ